MRPDITWNCGDTFPVFLDWSHAMSSFNQIPRKIPSLDLIQHLTAISKGWLYWKFDEVSEFANKWIGGFDSSWLWQRFHCVCQMSIFCHMNTCDQCHLDASVWSHWVLQILPICTFCMKFFTCILCQLGEDERHSTEAVYQRWISTTTFSCEPAFTPTTRLGTVD
jgi:hypothetical protein